MDFIFVSSSLFESFFFLYRPSEAEKVVSGNEIGRARSLEEVVKEFGDMACFALMLLAQVHFQTERHDKGVDATIKVSGQAFFYRNTVEINCF